MMSCHNRSYCQLTLLGDEKSFFRDVALIEAAHAPVGNPHCIHIWVSLVGLSGVLFCFLLFCFLRRGLELEGTFIG